MYASLWWRWFPAIRSFHQRLKDQRWPKYLPWMSERDFIRIELYKITKRKICNFSFWSLQIMLEYSWDHLGGPALHLGSKNNGDIITVLMEWPFPFRWSMATAHFYWLLCAEVSWFGTFSRLASDHRCDEDDFLPFVVSTRGWKTKDGPNTFLGCLSDIWLLT